MNSKSKERKREKYKKKLKYHANFEMMKNLSGMTEISSDIDSNISAVKC
jgi:hypothetical protein